MAQAGYYTLGGLFISFSGQTAIPLDTKGGYCKLSEFRLGKRFATYCQDVVLMDKERALYII